MLLVVWIAVPVLGLLVLGVVAYGVLGALQRLGREAAQLQRDVAPLLAQAQQVQARAGAGEPQGEPATNTLQLPGSGQPPA
ncbi:hypothetical protein [Blastococcus sp. TF02A-26]|uniref:hypothetical protein n=1 Tax=Blastococcus sp. TF02A-26 TaxID=2250577 RepID=UPI000DE9B96A|nr:hypothetical protein [Blastococcus sp. TF02A-26]RBY84746.1 hypothetical protein DQ240_14035 [Blastococcus sp. TF02A-26]